MKIFITGASGIVGSHVLLKLLTETNYNIKILIRNKNSLHSIQKIFALYNYDLNSFSNRYQWIYGDILDIPSLEEGMRDVDHVYHCAAIVSFAKRDGKKMIQTNVDGTANIVNIALENNIKKLGYISSIAALSGLKENNELINENDHWEKEKNPSNYSISKYYAELEVWRGIEEGLNAVIINPGMIIGPGQWGKSSTSFFPTMYKGMKFYPKGGTAFVSVDDVVNILLELMKSNISGERFVITAENISFKDFSVMLANSLHKKIPKYAISPFIANAAWIGIGIINMFLKNKIPVTRESMMRTQMTNYYDNTKIRETLNYTFSSVGEAINKTGKFYLKEVS